MIPQDESQYEVLLYYFLPLIFPIKLVIYTDSNAKVNTLIFKNNLNDNTFNVELNVKFGNTSIIYNDIYYNKYKNIIPYKNDFNYPLDKIKKISNYNADGIYGNTQGEINSVLGRSELEIEYITEINKNIWKTINFQYKLGPNNTNPKFLFFHTPRLDWKIYYAAKDEDLNNDSWIILLLGKLFEKNPIVMDLLGYEIEDKKYYSKISLIEKIKEVYFGKRKYELMSSINKLKIDIFKYQFLKEREKKNENIIFKRKRYKEYLPPIEKHTLSMVYEKLGLSKSDPNKKVQFNKFQFIPVIDIIIILTLGIFLRSKK
jgi:hypothetical protein